jgi:MoaA/NifB/PqqE/SkfB family radical SAM enzyme
MKLNSILFLISEKCSVGCDHCGYIGTARNGETEPSELLQWIAQAGAYGISGMLFTGGEPFDRLSVLVAAVQAADAAGVRSGVFTSSCWASSPSRACHILSRLPELSRLYLSTDIYHQRRVPVEYVRNAIDAAITLEIPEINLNITFATDKDRQAQARQFQDYEGRVTINGDRVVPTRYQRPDLLANQDPLRDLGPENYPSHCWIGTPFVNYNGDLFACHMGAGSTQEVPYFLGSLRSSSFSDIMASAERRIDYQYLRTHGPRGVAKLFQREPALFSDLPRTSFTTDCDMCRILLTHPGAKEALIRAAETHRGEIDVRRALLLKEAP